MSFKDLLVHVSVSGHCRQRLEISARLARTFGAHLTGFYTNPAGDVPFFTMEEISTDMQASIRAWSLQLRDRTKAAFENCVRDLGVDGEWAETTADAGVAVPYRARFFDLAVVGQVDPEELLPRAERDLPERVALESGRPVLVVPYAGNFPIVGRRVMVAWNASPQAVRAINDALPFLTRAEKVVLLTINPGSRSGHGGFADAGIVRHLARHGVEAQVKEMVAEDIAVDEMILSRGSDEEADLIVMGAYGHARTREVVLGGTTRHLFQHMTVPVLMSH
ncbi:MAG: universal stress protein [Pseudomonadota bacterium]